MLQRISSIKVVEREGSARDVGLRVRGVIGL